MMSRTKATITARRLTTVRAKGRNDFFSAGERAFIEWARRTAVPLSASSCSQADGEDLSVLDRLIGDATIIALGEAVHCTAQPLEFRNRLWQFLVREKGFTAIAIESGIVESRAIYDYVRGGKDELAAALARGIGWTFHRLPQNEALVRWIRRYNADAGRTRKVNFYGFDVAGSPANTEASQGVDVACSEALRYVRTVDEFSCTPLRERFAPLLPSLRFSLQRGARGPGYESWSQSQRDSMTAGIADLVTLLERNEAKYVAASTRKDYAWAYRAAIAARQVDSWLRQIPIGWQPLDGVEARADQLSFLPIAADVRDRAQADNLAWILEQEGPSGKVLVFAARYHLSAAPVQSSFWCSDRPDQEQQVAGTYLRKRFGERMLTICNLIGEGRADCDDQLHRAPRQSVDGLAREVGPARFVLDIRTAPPHVAKWLQEQHVLSDASQGIKLVLGAAFDALFYVDVVTPASGASTVT